MMMIYAPMQIGGVCTTAQRFCAALTLFILLGLPFVAGATHENDHRYTVYGLATGVAGAPVADAPVQITTIGGRLVGEGKTDADGNYSIILHVHGTDLGQRFWVTIGKTTQEGLTAFDPNDRLTPRQHRLDFVDLGSQ